MEKYIDTLNKMAKKIPTDYLSIGKMLADGVDNQHIGYKFSIFTLKNSDNNLSEKFLFYEISQVDYWKTIHNLNESDLELYFKALYEYCSYLGI